MRCDILFEYFYYHSVLALINGSHMGASRPCICIISFSVSVFFPVSFPFHALNIYFGNIYFISGTYTLCKLYFFYKNIVFYTTTSVNASHMGASRPVRHVICRFSLPSRRFHLLLIPLYAYD
jgi:hypothetical protein